MLNILITVRRRLSNVILSPFLQKLHIPFECLINRRTFYIKDIQLNNGYCLQIARGNYINHCFMRSTLVSVYLLFTVLHSSIPGLYNYKFPQLYFGKLKRKKNFVQKNQVLYEYSWQYEKVCIRDRIFVKTINSAWGACSYITIRHKQKLIYTGNER